MNQFHITWRCSACGAAGELRLPVPCDTETLHFTPWSEHEKRNASCAAKHEGSYVTATVGVDHSTVPLSRCQAALYTWVEEYIALNICAPSFEEIAAAFDYASLATVHEHLTSLERKGWIKRRYNESRSIECLVTRPAALENAHV